MDFKDLSEKALKVKNLYDKLNAEKGELAWTYREYTEGLVGDTGDLVKLIMAKSNFRGHKGNIDKDIEHELSDCLWSILVIANELDINLDKSFVENMNELDERVTKKITEASR